MSSVPILPLGLASWERSMRAAEEVGERLLRATAALDSAIIPYAVIGANAVAFWVARMDKGGVRNTPNVDLLVRRADFDRVRATLKGIGLFHHESAVVPTFLDSPETRLRMGIQVFFAGEKVKDDYLLPTPDVSEFESGERFRVLNLDALVRMKLTSFRTIDRVHLRDMIDVGLIDASWLNRFPPELAARLQHILDTPDG